MKTQSRMSWFSRWLLGLGLSAWVGTAGATTPAASGKECQHDTDCVLIPDGCCGCSAGGTQHAVPKSQAAPRQKAQQAKCHETACPAVISTHPSCFSVPACVHGQCVLTPHADAAAAPPASPSLPEVSAAKDIESRDGQVVRVLGKYVQVDVRMRPPPPPIYRGHVAIQLADGSLVFMYPMWQPEAIRSASERKRFSGQQVSVVGRLLRRAPPAPSGASIISPCLVEIQAVAAK